MAGRVAAIERGHHLQRNHKFSPRAIKMRSVIIVGFLRFAIPEIPIPCIGVIQPDKTRRICLIQELNLNIVRKHHMVWRGNEIHFRMGMNDHLRLRFSGTAQLIANGNRIAGGDVRRNRDGAACASYSPRIRMIFQFSGNGRVLS